jgi:hypothetical protein
MLFLLTNIIQVSSTHVRNLTFLAWQRWDMSRCLANQRERKEYWKVYGFMDSGSWDHSP